MIINKPSLLLYFLFFSGAFVYAQGPVQTAAPTQTGGLAAALSGSPGATDLPVDKNATKETVHLYRHLKQLTGKKILFGHQDDLAYGVGWKYIPGRSDIKDVTGEYPAVYGWELGRLELDHAVNIDSVPFDKMKGFIREGYERGGVITISWHLNNPLTGGTAWQPAPGTVASILPGGEKHALYKTWLDKVASFLASLKGKHDEPIPVILRLFHELNGNWFWWGGKNCTPDELKQLWRFTVSYLRDERQLHNLLYAFNTDRFASEEAWLEKYPGDEWVDVAGFDIYQANNIAKNEDFMLEFGKTLSMLEKIAAERNKIPALTEFGYNGLPDSVWWTHVFGKTLEGHRIAYALTWRNAGFGPGGHAQFFAPYKGQTSAEDFSKMVGSGRILLQTGVAKEKIYE
ncbi:MAG TPA: glycosyl hydrolase [Puia sp.]|nr:glycosyl hydrolase [Puia sp.]